MGRRGSVKVVEYKEADEYWIVSSKGKRTEEPIPDWVELEGVHDGYGYYGVLKCDPTTGKVQCHICGEWYEVVGAHIKVHGYDADTYREDFELSSALGLCSVAYAEFHRKHAQEMGLIDFVKDKGLPSPGNNKLSLQGSYMNQRNTKSEEFGNAVSAAQKRRYQDPKQRQARKELMDRIRPLSTAKTKGKPRLTPFSDEHKRKLSLAHSNRSDEYVERREQQLTKTVSTNDNSCQRI